MSAKEMFEKLGYMQTENSKINNDLRIKYESNYRDEHLRSFTNVVSFYNGDWFTETIIMETRFNESDNKKQYAGNVELNKYIIKAIQKQIEELGWEV